MHFFHNDAGSTMLVLSGLLAQASSFSTPSIGGGLKPQTSKHCSPGLSFFRQRRAASAEGEDVKKKGLPKEALTPVSDYAMWNMLPSMFEKHSNAQATKASAETYTGYIPAGLTKEQYLAMKRNEQKKEEKQDYATWGPRFATTDRPDGDWMVQPSLWRDGFIAKSPYEETVGATNRVGSKVAQTTKHSWRPPAVRLVRYYLPVALLVMSSLQLVSVTNSYKAQQNLIKFATQKRFAAKSVAAKVTLTGLIQATPWIRNMFLSITMSPLMDLLMANTFNGKFQCSRRRCLTSWSIVNVLIGCSLLGVRALA
jgi:hypothetical protein